MSEDLHDRQIAEWEAWHAVCQELRELGVNVNTAGFLACAMRLWGESLVNLSKDQPESVLERRLRSARERYPQLEEKVARFRSRRKEEEATS